MDFIESLVGRPNTIKTYRSLFNRHIEKMVTAPKSWTEVELDRAMMAWYHEDLAPNTIKALLILTTKYIHWSGGPKLNPNKAIRTALKIHQEEPIKALTKGEVGRLVTACQKDKKILTPVMFALHTGMRKGEVFGLKWGDIDLLKGEVLVQRSYDGPTKNGKNRIIPISYHLEQFILTFFQINSDNYLGTRVIAKQFDPGPLLKANCKKARVRPINFHGLRHTFAVLALEAGRSPKMVQKALGHSSLTTTLEIYWSLTNEKLDMGFLK